MARTSRAKTVKGLLAWRGSCLGRAMSAFAALSIRALDILIVVLIVTALT